MDPIAQADLIARLKKIQSVGATILSNATLALKTLDQPTVRIAGISVFPVAQTLQWTGTTWQPT